MKDERAVPEDARAARRTTPADTGEATGRADVPAARPHRPGVVEAGVSALNGAFGDYLRTRRNPLEIEMAFYHENAPLTLTLAEVERAYPRATSYICVMVHGLGCNESVWSFPNDRRQSYASLLHDELGYSPMWVRYNSGLHISQNGRRLAKLMAELMRCYPVAVQEIVLIGHSMGGLVIRSACHYGEQHGHDWVERVRHVFYLGTPHFGTALEKLGNVVSGILGWVPTPYTRLAADVLNLRSSGVKDLRFANLVDEDWDGHDPDAVLRNVRKHVALLEGAAHHVIVGTLTADDKHVLTALFGDAIVGVASAAGQAPHEARSPLFPKDNIVVFPGIRHLDLARSRAVYARIRRMCQGGDDRVSVEEA